MGFCAGAVVDNALNGGEMSNRTGSFATALLSTCGWAGACDDAARRQLGTIRSSAEAALKKYTVLLFFFCIIPFPFQELFEAKIFFDLFLGPKMN
jgi:hypothetical protein